MTLYWDGDEWVSDNSGEIGWIDRHTGEHMYPQELHIQFEDHGAGYEIVDNKLDLSKEE